MSQLRGMVAKLMDWPLFRKDFLFITLDSLRYDVAIEAMEAGETPNFKALVGQWERREASATYTLPSHISMFSGMMPRPPKNDNKALAKEGRMFALSTSWERYKGRNIRYFFEDVANVPKGFESKGYHTIGVGGVGWFSTEVKASSFWQGQYFQHYLYKPSYGEDNPQAFGEQIADLRDKLEGLGRDRKFVFVNVSSTHRPYSNGDGSISTKSQRRCLAYVDSQLPNLLRLFSPGTVGVVCADHGDCMGEDGLWGHNFAHEQVLTVPYGELEL
jgi:hypothetical protein